MIAPMRRLTLVCLERDRETVLERLRELGALHVDSRAEDVGPDLSAVDQSLDRLDHVLAALPENTAPAADAVAEDAEAALTRASRLLAEREALAQEHHAVQAELARLAPLGTLAPGALEELAELGLHLRIFRTTAGASGLPPLAQGLTVIHQAETSAGLYFAVAGPAEISVDAQAVELPPGGTLGLALRERDDRARLADMDAQLLALAAQRQDFQDLRLRLVRRRNLLEVRQAMDLPRDAQVAVLAGYVPAAVADEVATAMAAMGCGTLLAQPQADEDVPTLLQLPAWAEPIRPVLAFVGLLPGYFEPDVSPVFLVTLVVFVGMLVGDAGYGLVFLAMALAGPRLLPAAPPAVFRLVLLFSLAAIAWGALSGAWFGVLPRPLAAVVWPWIAGPQGGENVMLLCFLLGALHLTMAHAINLLRFRGQLVALAEVGWIVMTWAMFFLARHMVLGHALPWAVGWSMAVAGLLVAAFMTPVNRLKAEWFNHVILPLKIIGNFVDVVSYLRLFAVGAAGLAMAQAFNDLALSTGSALGGGAGLAAAAAVLLVGHAMNMILAALAVLVHGVRLNALEFSGHVGLNWTGRPYRPFGGNTKP